MVHVPKSVFTRASTSGRAENPINAKHQDSLRSLSVLLTDVQNWDRLEQRQRQRRNGKGKEISEQLAFVSMIKKLSQQKTML